MQCRWKLTGNLALVSRLLDDIAATSEVDRLSIFTCCVSRKAALPNWIVLVFEVRRREPVSQSQWLTKTCSTWNRFGWGHIRPQDCQCSGGLQESTMTPTKIVLARSSIWGTFNSTEESVSCGGSFWTVVARQHDRQLLRNPEEKVKWLEVHCQWQILFLHFPLDTCFFVWIRKEKNRGICMYKFLSSKIS